MQSSQEDDEKISETTMILSVKSIKEKRVASLSDGVKMSATSYLHALIGHILGLRKSPWRFFS